MIELTAESVADAMLSCYNYFNRKVGIAFSSHKKMYDFAISLQRQQREGLVPATHYKRGIDEIFFDTGSSIRMLDASDPRNAYGLDFDSVLYDPNIRDEDIKAHMASCERRRFIPQSHREMEIDTQPLDDFLSEFSIIV